MDAIHEYKRPDYRVSVYHDRIEIEDTIPIGKVARVVLSPYGKLIVLVLTDGSERKLRLFGRDAEGVSKAILEATGK